MAPKHVCLHEWDFGAIWEFKGEVLRKIDNIDKKLDRFFDELKLKADKLDVDKLERDIAINYVRKSWDWQDKDINWMKSDLDKIKRTFYTTMAIIWIVWAIGWNLLASWIREKLIK